MNKPLILVVEDDPAVARLISTTLETRNYQYHRVQNGAGALLEAASARPDVILLDLGLPDMDGIDVIRKIRGWSNVPILVVSARSDDTDKVSALDAGADDYLTKPFSVEELLARLRVALRRVRYDTSRAGDQASIYENGELRIDYAAGCVYRGGTEIHLTPIEYKLICGTKSGAARLHRTHRPCACLWQRCAKKLRKTPATPAISRPTSALVTA